MILLILFLIALTYFLLYFYRDPERKIPNGDNIVSPADGKIIEISEKKAQNKVVIFMNLHNVHVQRVPISGKVEEIKNISGKNLPANKKDASHNKCIKTTLKTKIGIVEIKQMTGFFVRRITNYLKKGNSVTKGQRLGRIAFGSRVEVYFPKNKTKIKVKKDQIVFAGESIIANIK